jgi:hypothetical protein
LQEYVDVLPIDGVLIDDFRTNPFEERGKDENQQATPHDLLHVSIRPITRLKTNKIK